MSEKTNIKEKKHVFEGRIKEIEQIIIEYYLDSAKFNDQSLKVAEIMGYLSIHGKLTQTQLKELINFSISTISTNLSNLINIRYVKKELIRGTHKYLYFSVIKDEVLGNVSKEIDFFKKIINELENQNLKAKRGYNLLVSRIKENIRVFELYHKILEFLQDPSIKLEINNNIEEKKGISIEDLKILEEDFDPEIKKIEDRIIDFLMHQSAYSTLNIFPLMFFAYFITRKILTQEKLRTLTRLSLGKVSQVLKKLIKRKDIEKIDREDIKQLVPLAKTRKIYYSMTSIQTSFMSRAVISLKEILKWEEKFRALKAELEENEEKLHLLNGFDEVLHAIEDIMNLIVDYQKACKIFRKFIQD